MTDAPALWPLTPDRVGEWRTIRLEALADAPGIFLGDWAEWTTRPVADFLPPLAESDCWAAGRSVGQPLAVARWGRHDRIADAGMLMSVFARPQARGTGMIDALIVHLLGRAAPQVRQMRLHVAETNTRAIRLYERHGFRRTERPATMNQSGIPEIEMQRALP